MAAQRAKIVVYRTRYCPFCVATERLLREREIEFEEVALDSHPDRRQATSAIMPGHTTVPLVLIDGDPVGGYQELRDLDGSGELARRVWGEAS